MPLPTSKTEFREADAAVRSGRKNVRVSRWGRAFSAMLVVLLAGGVAGMGAGIAGCGNFFISQNVHVTTTTLADGVVNVSYSETLAATGGFAPYTWTVTSGTLPDELSINSTTGAITGIPSTVGPSTFIVTATDQNGDVGTASLTLTIDAGAKLAVSTTTLPGGTVGTAYSETLAATGGTPPYTWSLPSGNLPPGLTGVPSTGVISGKPTTAGTYPFTVEVTDADSATATANLSIVVSAAASNVPAEDSGR